MGDAGEGGGMWVVAGVGGGGRQWGAWGRWCVYRGCQGWSWCACGDPGPCVGTGGGPCSAVVIAGASWYAGIALGDAAALPVGGGMRGNG